MIGIEAAAAEVKGEATRDGFPFYFCGMFVELI
jgi:hypothetical protein